MLDVRRVWGPPAVVTLEVRNPRHKSHYTLYVPAYPDHAGAYCGCVDFARRDLGTCKHLEAAWLWLADHPGEQAVEPVDGSSRLWAAIDRRTRRLPRNLPGSDRVRYAGALLLG